MAVRIRVDVIGEEELRRKLQSLTEAVQGQALAAAVMSGAQVIQNAAKEKAPYRTGTLRRSIHTEVEGNATRATAKIGTDVVYAAQVEFGGTITPKKAKLLAWVGSDGVKHFARSVTQVARPYLRPAFDEQGDNAVVEVREALAQVIAKVAP